ncbi:MAG: hypothetical protein ACE5HI_12580, partial [bacterium]
MSPYKALIFDLGNVIFNVSFDGVFHYWAKVSKRDFNDIKRKFEFDTMLEQFERGEITPESYRSHVR